MEEEQNQANEEAKNADLTTTSADDVSPIEEAKKINEEMKKNLEDIRSERKKLEKLHADALINGRPMTNQTPIKKVETDKEYKDRIMRGEI